MNYPAIYNIKKIIPLFITSAIFLIIFKIFGFENLIKIVSEVKVLDIIFPTIIITVLIPLLLALRLKKMLEILDCRINLKSSLKITLATFPVSKIMPANLGEFVRIYYLKNRISPDLCAGGVVLERIMDIFVLAILSFFGGIILGIKSAIVISSSILLLMSLFFILINRIHFKSERKVINTINNFFHVFRISIKNPRKLSLMLLYTFCSWLITITYIKIMFLIFGKELSFLTILSIQPLVAFVSILPITISGAGTRELTMLYLYKDMALDHTILAVGLSYTFLSIVIFPLVGLPIMYRIIKYNKK